MNVLSFVVVLKSLTNSDPLAPDSDCCSLIYSFGFFSLNIICLSWNESLKTAS